MSYNVSGYIVRTVEGLKFPIKSVVPDKWGEPKIEINDPTNLSAKLICGEVSELKGTIEREDFLVEDIIIYGMGSGYLVFDILPELLKDSPGSLDVLLIWEGGDKFTNLKVENGVFSNEEVTPTW
jgi:hypothetical protein